MTVVKGGELRSPDGGTLEVAPDQPLEVEGSIQQTATGHAFGPLELSVYPDSTARIGALEFKQAPTLTDRLFGSSEEGLFGSLLLVGGAAAAHDGDEPTADGISRRAFLQAAGVGALAAGASTQASAAVPDEPPADLLGDDEEDDAPLRKAQFSVLENTGGIRIRVFDRVEGVMPPDGGPYHSYVDGERYATFTAAAETDYGDVLPEQVGTAVVGPDGAAGGFLATIGTEKTVSYDGLPLSQPTGEADTGEAVTITDNDIVVEHVQDVGADGTTLAINGVSVPHRHESLDSERGYFEVHNGSLVYRVGSDPPTGQTATLALYASDFAELLDDLDRTVS